MLFPDAYNFVFDLKAASNLLSKIFPIPNLSQISFQYFQYGFRENLFNSVTQKFTMKPKFYFMINPITFATYLKLTLKRFPKIYPIINF